MSLTFGETTNACATCPGCSPLLARRRNGAVGAGAGRDLQEIDRLAGADPQRQARRLRARRSRRSKASRAITRRPSGAGSRAHSASPRRSRTSRSSCRQIGPIRFKEKFEQGDVVFSERRSLIFKRMHIVRGCDAKRNTLVYMVYSDRPIEGSPKNSTSSVPLMPWGTEAAAEMRRMGDGIN